MPGGVVSHAHVVEDGSEPVRVESCSDCRPRDHTASSANGDGATSFKQSAVLNNMVVLALLSMVQLVQRGQRRADRRREQHLRHTTKFRRLMLRTSRQLMLAAQSTHPNTMAMHSGDLGMLELVAAQRQRTLAKHREHMDYYE